MMSLIESNSDADDEDTWLLQNFDPRRGSQEAASAMAFVLLISGMILMGLGYFIPRDYTFDPYEEARKMESIEQYYITLAKHLDILILVGMAIVCTGGVIVSVLFAIGMYRAGYICNWSGSKPSGTTGRGDRGIGIPDYGSRDMERHLMPNMSAE
ncbi:unnamed protein product [Owenia fusiformis]|uniref:Uncharacterized protein n=1 Tax=Owenia fusiformis TaxID=6347 RepID=A0A8S4MZN3_OWEFU|nr:unnamed protein product [Owenia fusiformis]